MALKRMKKKGARRKVVDAFARKEWYTLRAPMHFAIRDFGYTIASKSQGTRLASDSLKGRVFSTNLGLLSPVPSNITSQDDLLYFRKISLACEDLSGRALLTDFHGMDITRDKLCSMIRRGHTLIEAVAEGKTLDGYHLRVFIMGMTQRHSRQEKTTCYATASQVKRARNVMQKRVQDEIAKSNFKDLVKKFLADRPATAGRDTAASAPNAAVNSPDNISRAIQRECHMIFPLQNVLLRKVKVLKKPKFDIVRLTELHKNTGAGDGRLVVKEADASKNLLE